jgi:hypothetical protein
MSNDLVEVAEGISTGVYGDEQLVLSTNLRNLMAKELIKAAPTDLDTLKVALAALKANDAIALAEKRMTADKDIGQDNNAAIIEASLNLKAKYGNAMEPTDDESLTVPRERPELDGSTFTFTNGESIVGLDTEEAVNGTT